MGKKKRKVRQMSESLLPVLQERLGEDAVITAWDLPGADQETMHLRVEVREAGVPIVMRLRYRPDRGVLEVDLP